MANNCVMGALLKADGVEFRVKIFLKSQGTSKN